MNIIILLNMLLLIILLQKFNIEKTLKRVLNIYIVFTSIILFISSLNPFELYDVHNRIYQMWIIYLDIFIITIAILIKKISFKNNVNIVVKKIYKSKILLIIQILLCVVLGFYVIRFLVATNMLTNQSEIREYIFSDFFISFVEYFFYYYIIMTLYNIMTIITAILAVNKQYKNPIFIIGIINIVLKMLIGYGRMNLFEFAIFILIAFLIFKENIKIKLNKKNIIIFVLIIIIIIFLFIMPTAVRLGISPFDFNALSNNVANTLLKQGVIYFTGGFRALDTYLTSGFENINNLTFGRATFGGIDEIIGIAIKCVNENYMCFNDLIGYETQEEIMIGKNIAFNAFYTCIMNFYCDFGYIRSNNRRNLTWIANRNVH